MIILGFVKILHSIIFTTGEFGWFFSFLLQNIVLRNKYKIQQFGVSSYAKLPVKFDVNILAFIYLYYYCCKYYGSLSYVLCNSETCITCSQYSYFRTDDHE